MNDSPPNLFNSLFAFYPRDGHTPRENFLSEAFAYVLKTCEGACDAWLSLAMGRPIQATELEVSTRRTQRDEEGAVFPDMAITGKLDGKSFCLYSEHKWDSPCNPNQLCRYLKLTDQGVNNCHLVFVGASRRQKKIAISCDRRIRRRAFLWEDAYKAFQDLSDKSDILVQFLDFMKTHGLSPARPIDSNTMLAFIQSAGFLTTLEHCANKLNDDFDWEFLPKRYRSNEERNVNGNWGRVAIEFTTPEWKPTITVGFLIDERDHKVLFVNRQKGIDLLLRIETRPRDQKNMNIAHALAALDHQRKKLSRLAASALLLHEPGNGNSHSLLIVRSCLADVIEKATTQQEQLEAIYETVRDWGERLFSDGALEKAFVEAGLDSGI